MQRGIRLARGKLWPFVPLFFALAMFFPFGCGSTEFSPGKGRQAGDQPRGDDLTEEPEIPESLDQEREPEEPEATQEDSGTVTDRFLGLTQVDAPAPVDILFVVDTSPSMDDEKRMLEDNIQGFVEQLAANSGLDYQVFMMGEDFSFPGVMSDRFAVIDREVDSWDALARAAEFLQNPVTPSITLRESSVKEIVVVTDDDARDMDGDEFIEFLDDRQSTLGSVHLNGFVWLPESVGDRDGGPEWCTKDEVGEEYMKVASHSAYGGRLYDLCTPDWSVLLDELVSKILEKRAKLKFELTHSVDRDDEVFVVVDGRNVDDEHWSLAVEDSSDYILFHKDYAPGEGDVVEVSYTKR